MGCAEKELLLTRGPASGIGLATAVALGDRHAGWEIHVLDYNAAGAAAVDAVAGGVFHAVDVTDYAALGVVFRDVFRRHRRLDFVYANAGVGERVDAFYDRPASADSDEPPPPPPGVPRIVDVVLTAAATTAYLAQHYFRLSPVATRGERVLTFTASCGSLYPVYGSPLYAAAKHGVLGLARCMDRYMWRRDGVRVNAVLPGVVRTNLLAPELWQLFPDAYFTPVEQIVRAVLLVLDNRDPARPDLTVLKGQAIECSGANMYYRAPYAFCDEAMQRVMEATDTGK